MKRCVTVLAGFLAFSAIAKAGDGAVQLDVDSGSLPEQADLIQAEILADGYVEMDVADRVWLVEQLRLLQAGTVSLKTQERINGILRQAYADSRLVCTAPEKAPNSHIRKIKYCKTAAEWKRETQLPLPVTTRPVAVPNN